MADDNALNTVVEDCTVCFDECTDNNKAIKCPKCDIVACQECWKVNFTQLQGATPYCINTSCEHEFTLQFIFKNFPKNFIEGELREHHMNEYYNVQKEKLKNVIPIIRRIHIRETIDTEIKFLTEKRQFLEQKVREVADEINKLNREKDYNFPIYQERDYPVELVDLYVNGNREPLRNWFQTNTVKSNANQSKTEEQKGPKYHYKCPEAGCGGFLDGKFRCGLCANHFCSDCFELIGKPSENVKLSDLKEEHECKDEDKASFDLIKESTHPCPKCRTRIHKSSGCRQMWCVVCHTTFDYYTGKIETGNIHNPHYHEFMRQNKDQQNEPRDIELCHGEVVELTSIQGRLNRNNITEAAQERFKIIARYHELITEMRQYVINQYEVDPQNVETYIRDMSIKFLMEEIPEEEFKKKLYDRERVNEKNRRLWEILDLFTVAGADTINSFYQIIDENYSEQVVESTISQLNELVKYCNDSLNGSIEALCFKTHPIFHISNNNYITLFSSNNHPSFVRNEFKNKNFGDNHGHRNYNHNYNSYI